MDEAAAKFSAIVSEYFAPDSQWKSMVSDAIAEFPSVKLFRFVAEANEKPTGIYEAEFSLFIQGFGNPELYHNVSSALLKQIQPRVKNGSISLLDIGPGDGKVLFSVFSWLDCPRIHVDLVEPSNFLSSCIELLQTLGFVEGKQDSSPRTYSCFPITAQTFLKQKDSDISWNVIQSTFALHNLSPTERKTVYSRLLRSTEVLLLAEFDIPIRKAPTYVIEGERLPCIDKNFAKLVLDRYERAIQLWEDTGGFSFGTPTEKKERSRVVLHGFLIPIMLGYFATKQKNVTYEAPMIDWIKEIEDLGFHISGSIVHEYWWADCFMLVVSSD